MTNLTSNTDHPPSTHAPIGARLIVTIAIGFTLCAVAWTVPIPEADAPVIAYEMEPIIVDEPASVPLPDTTNDRVEFWIRKFTTHNRGDFQVYLSRQGRFESLIRSKLREQEMPEDLLYLAMIESGFNPTIRSHASAIGLWQFMAATARGYGLRVDEFVDERRDPVASTDAALAFLRDLYNQYGSWYLAAAAYNGGPGRVSRILRTYANNRTGEESLYWEIIDHLPRETRNYVPKLLAARRVAEQAPDHGFEIPDASEYRYDTIAVTGGTSFEMIAELTGIDVETLRQLNPHLLRDMTPPSDAVYDIRVPSGRGVYVQLAMAQGAREVALAE